MSGVLIFGNVSVHRDPTHAISPDIGIGANLDHTGQGIGRDKINGGGSY